MVPPCRGGGHSHVGGGGATVPKYLPCFNRYYGIFGNLGGAGHTGNGGGVMTFNVYLDSESTSEKGYMYYLCPDLDLGGTACGEGHVRPRFQV